MPFSQISKQLNENLQLAYRQAIDADEKLKQLKKEGHGKFAAIFRKDQGFQTESTFFLPYVKEIALEQQQITTSNDISQQTLSALINKLAILLSTLQQFKQQMK